MGTLFRYHYHNNWFCFLAKWGIQLKTSFWLNILLKTEQDEKNNYFTLFKYDYQIVVQWKIVRNVGHFSNTESNVLVLVESEKRL